MCDLHQNKDFSFTIYEVYFLFVCVPSSFGRKISNFEKIDTNKKGKKFK